MAHLDIVFARIAHDFRRGIKAHGLGIQQGTGKRRGMVFLDPCRNINEMGKARGMAFGKAVGAEALNLLEAASGEIRLIAARHHAAHEFVLEIVDGADIAKGRHGAAQAIGFFGREFRRHNGKLHRLFLKQRNALRLAEHVVELIRLAMLRRGRRIFDLLGATAPSEIGVNHVALNGAGTHDRHFNDEIIEIPGLQPWQHVHLRPAFHLEHANGIGLLQHVINRRVLALARWQDHMACLHGCE